MCWMPQPAALIREVTPLTAALLRPLASANGFWSAASEIGVVSGMAWLTVALYGPHCRSVLLPPTLGQLRASCTAAVASATPKPYSWL